MIVYQSLKEGFLNDVINNEIEIKIESAYRSYLGRKPSPNEVFSWANSMQRMKNVLEDSEIASDAGISIEFQIPLTSKRIDFIISGLDVEKREKVVIIELKQWSSAELTDLPDLVRTRFQYGFTNTVHPSYQAWSYASTLLDYNKTIQDDKIDIIPCAYLHNYIPDSVITNDFFKYYIDKAPVFLRNDALKLREFIKRFVKFGDSREIMYRIENGKLRPSKQLADSVGSMLKGVSEFIMIDDQKLVYETALKMARVSKSGKKQVLIVEGGPGTGKSVVAINLLANLTKEGMVAKYISKNAAPRAVYVTKLKGRIRNSSINNLFGGSGSFVECEKNIFDALIVDEAHRLNLKSGLFQNLGDNQILEIIQASKFSVFFIDNDQRVHIKDIGTSKEISDIAIGQGAQVAKLKLESQFRCNGSDGYLSWLDNTLQITNTANIKLSNNTFDFRIFEDPNELRRVIEEKNLINNKSRIVAGYCWDWKSQRNPDDMDVVIPEFNFAMRWNLKNDGSNWIIAPNSINEAGCIHTCQGLELDYVGVIVGPDIRFENDEVVTDFNGRSSMDQSLKGIKTKFKESPEEALQIAGRIIKNTYRTLMTRGMKGCYVYFCDKNLAEYFSKQMEFFEEEVINLDPVIDQIRIEPDVIDSAKYVDFLPFYTIKAACGKFGEGEEAQISGWVRAEGLGKLNKNMFVVKASGRSMEPKIPDGSLCVFRANVIGSRNNKIVLVQHNSLFDSDNSGNFTIKTYTSKKSYDTNTGEWQHESIVLNPINNSFDPIILSEDDSYQVVGELVAVL
ncbi:MAG: DUF2075 domain-containing protein [Bacteroidales bacterium]|nr:DUF2075 domain-containing protein [Bacteroidales bacterium]